MSRRVALVTCEAWPDLTEDDRLLLPALRAAGFAPVPAIWSDRKVHWSEFAAVIVRSTWDYTTRYSEFLGWIARLDAPVWNPASTLRWNSNKTYLLELAEKEVAIVPGSVVRRDETFELPAVEGQGWVVKPTVSAGGRDTWKIGGGDPELLRARIEEVLTRSDVLVQPFIPEIETEGEVSLFFFDREYSHAVLKRPKIGEFRVQHKHGGTVEAYFPDPGLIRSGRKILDTVPGELLYARLDGVRTRDRGFLLMELELIEPELFFRTSGEAPSHFVSALERVIKKAST